MVATKKMTHLEFIQKAYETLRKPGKNGVVYVGMHTVFTGFNEAFRKYFDADPVKAVEKLAASGELRVRGARGGAIIYLGDDVAASGGDKALKAMGLE